MLVVDVTTLYPGSSHSSVGSATTTSGTLAAALGTTGLRVTNTVWLAGTTGLGSHTATMLPTASLICQRGTLLATAALVVKVMVIDRIFAIIPEVIAIAKSAPAAGLAWVTVTIAPGPSVADIERPFGQPAVYLDVT